MSRTTLAFSTLLTLLVAFPLTAEVREPAAVEVAERAIAAVGGQDGLDATRHIRFNFFGFRTHHWDRYSGDHRLEGQNREGQHYVVLHNLNTGEGRAWLDGEQLTGDAEAEQLTGAHQAWINDVYWLMFPFKLLDPGVNLRAAGEETIDGRTFDVIELSFEAVGLTPGDRYWAYVDRETGRLDRWAFHLESWEAEREKSVWTWSDWQEHGAIELAATRTNLENGGSRGLANIAVFDSLPASVYESPEPVTE